MQYPTLLASLLATAVLPAVQAADTLSPIVVTATRTARSADATLAPVTVITRADIERLQAASVPELLAGTPGLAIANNGGPGKATALFLRGTESDHVLVLVDGVKIGSATLGTAALEHIPVDAIERIEIVRGPRASLYGSEAIGGVVQIFTRKGGGAPRVHGRLTAGSYGTTGGGAGLSGGGQNGWFALDVSARHTDGFNACDPAAASAFAGCFTSEPDRDGYRNQAGSLRAGYRFGNGLSVDVHGLLTSGKVFYDGGFTNESEPFQRELGARLRWDVGETWGLSLSAGRSTDVSEDAKDGTPVSRFQTDRDSAGLQLDWAPGDAHMITLGADYLNDQVSGTTAYAVDERDDKGVFVQYQGRIGRHDLSLRLRRDDNEQFGNHTTGGLSVGHDFAGHLRLVASYGKAFKAPTFNELYYPGFGNDQLRPETSESVELGLRGRPAWGRWAVSLYQTRIDDLIAFDATTFAPANIDEARIRGLEGELAGRLAGWDLQAALTLLRPENRGSGVNRGNTLPRRARATLRLDADRQWGRWRLGGTVLRVGKRYDDLANSRELDPYTRVDLRAALDLGGHWSLQLKGENVFDADYQTAAFYNQPGASAYVTLRYGQ